jgi:zinc protease
MDQAKLDLQRDVVKNERRQGVDNAPYGKADETILPVLFPTGHPYSWDVIGSMDDLSAAALDDVKDFFRRYYAPDNATITIAGDFDPDSAKAWVRKYFGQIPRSTSPITRPTAPAISRTRDTVLVLEDRVQLPRLYYTWHGVKAFSTDDAALDAVADVIAGGKSSRLYRTLVYEKQLAQDVRMSNQSQKLDGMIQLVVTARPGVTPQEIDAEITRTLNALIADGPSERELTRVKNGMRASMLDGLSNVASKAFRLSYYNYLTGQPDYLAQDLARYDALTTATVQRAARTYLAGTPRVVLTIVPEGKRSVALTAATIGGIK